MTAKRKKKDGLYDGTKKYVVWFTDEYNNNYLIGFYDDLADAEEEADRYLVDYEDADNGGKCSVKGKLREYPSSFSYCFDRIFITSVGGIGIRGFILK